MSITINTNTLKYRNSNGTYENIVPSVQTGDSSGSGVTYTLQKSGSTITLMGSDGSTSSVTDEVGSGGSGGGSSVTYTLEKTGSMISLKGSDGSTSSVTDSTSTGSAVAKGVVTLEEFGGIPDNTSATARSANVKAMTDALRAGYNIQCANSGATSSKTYYFNDVVDVREIQYRNVDIDLNGNRLRDFHIIVNMNTALTKPYNDAAISKFWLRIHDGLIGAAADVTMSNHPNDPIVITGSVPIFENLQVIGKTYLLAMPKSWYGDQIFMSNICQVSINQNNYSWWQHDSICAITGVGTGNDIGTYEDNGVDLNSSRSNCIRGDQFVFEKINSFHRFFTICGNNPTQVIACISPRFGIKNSNVHFIDCHYENPVFKDDSAVSNSKSWFEITFTNCYFEQDALNALTNLSYEVLQRISFDDCQLRIGTCSTNGNSDVPLEASHFSFLLKCKRANIAILSINSLMRRVETVPFDMYCYLTPSTNTAISIGNIANDQIYSNNYPETYSYNVYTHTTSNLNYANASASKSGVTVSSFQYNLPITITNYIGQMIALYKTDSKGNKYRALIHPVPLQEAYQISVMDCGCYVSASSIGLKHPLRDSGFQHCTVWEKVNSIPTVTTNTKLRQSGGMIYDTDGNIYAPNMTKLS